MILHGVLATIFIALTYAYISNTGKVIELITYKREWRHEYLSRRKMISIIVEGHYEIHRPIILYKHIPYLIRWCRTEPRRPLRNSYKFKFEDSREETNWET
jgi:hypothetical protein